MWPIAETTEPQDTGIDQNQFTGSGLTGSELAHSKRVCLFARDQWGDHGGIRVMTRWVSSECPAGSYRVPLLITESRLRLSVSLHTKYGTVFFEKYLLSKTYVLSFVSAFEYVDLPV